MSIRNTIATLVLTSALGLSGGFAWAETTTLHDHPAAVMELTLNGAEKWKGDLNMVKGVESIRDAVATRLEAIHHDSLPPAEYKTLASDIQKQVDFMVENCKLEPEVDAQFHIVLAQMIDGIGELEGEANPRQGAELIVQALNAYGEHFEHPNWQSLK